MSDKPKFQKVSDIVGAAKSAYVPTWEKEVEPSRHIVGASAAKQKRGKTTFGFTMPDPMAYLQIDSSGSSALKKARDAGRDIKHLKYFADPRADIKSENMRVWESLVRDFDYCIRNFRSVLLDTGTELLDIRKLAEHGRNDQIVQRYYGAFWADFRYLIKTARDSAANFWMTHRVKPEWIANESTGNDVINGWKDIVYETQVFVLHDRDAENKFNTTIMECEQDAMLNGMTLSQDDGDNNFAGLAMLIYPETTLADWGAEEVEPVKKGKKR